MLNIFLTRTIQNIIISKGKQYKTMLMRNVPFSLGLNLVCILLHTQHICSDWPRFMCPRDTGASGRRPGQGSLQGFRLTWLSLRVCMSKEPRWCPLRSTLGVARLWLPPSKGTFSDETGGRPAIGARKVLQRGRVQVQIEGIRRS